ncbi:MAG: hypothetical protein JNM72_21670 [Deltaproteobacteria bacterium]|nr:hypothetical protein [Deltaproteobacteria bacterium]
MGPRVTRCAPLRGPRILRGLRSLRGLRVLRSLALAALVACGAERAGGKADDGADPAPQAEAERDRAVRLLSRASLDLRGHRPTLADLRAVEADPTAVDALVQGYLDAPGFGWAYAERHAGVWLTPLNEADFDQAAYPMEDELAVLRAFGEEPLRVLAEVAENDLPYTDLVLADWTVADDFLARHYPTDYPDGATGWRRVRWTDGRPAAGVLSTNGLYWRYDSTQANANRGRANAVSRILTCRDYLDSVIEGDRDLNLLDQAAVNDALRNDAACVTCHASLDPVAAYFWGFYNHFSFSPAEQSTYHAEREPLWEVYGGVAPGWYGQPGDGLRDLGLQIASDPRFIECAVERAMEQLLDRPAHLADTEALVVHREAFIDGGLRLRALVASVLRDPAYAAGLPGSADSLPAGLDPARAPGLRQLRAAQLARTLEELTGYRLVEELLDVVATDLYGMRSLSGGLGPSWDTEQIVEPTTTGVLVQRRLAEAAAGAVVTADLDSATPRLLPAGAASLRAGDPAMAAALVDLHLRLYGRRVAADDPEIDDLVSLFDEVEALTGSSQTAWTALLTAMLRDPDLLLY